TFWHGPPVSNFCCLRKSTSPSSSTTFCWLNFPSLVASTFSCIVFHAQRKFVCANAGRSAKTTASASEASSNFLGVFIGLSRGCAAALRRIEIVDHLLEPADGCRVGDALAQPAERGVLRLGRLGHLRQGDDSGLRLLDE